jgi:hypothetical protein
VAKIYRCLLDSTSLDSWPDALKHVSDLHGLSEKAKDYIIERQTDDLAGERE